MPFLHIYSQPSFFRCRHHRCIDDHRNASRSKISASNATSSAISERWSRSQTETRLGESMSRQICGHHIIIVRSDERNQSIDKQRNKTEICKYDARTIKNYMRISGNVLLVIVFIHILMFFFRCFSLFHYSWALCRKSWKIILFVWTLCRTPSISVTFRYGLYTIKHLNFCHELMYQLPV